MFEDGFRVKPGMTAGFIISECLNTKDFVIQAIA